MADAPWRCSQCGTVNAPAANACRTCGRWPSLFDLERGAVDAEGEREQAPFEDEPSPTEEAPYRREAPYSEEAPSADEAMRAEESRAPAEPAEVEPTRPPASDAPWPGPEPPIPSAPPGSSLRRLSRLIVPLLVLIYIVFTAVRNR